MNDVDKIDKNNNYTQGGQGCLNTNHNRTVRIGQVYDHVTS